MSLAQFKMDFDAFDDFESIEDKKVTVRDRDTMQQERVPIAQLRAYLADALQK